MNKNRKSSFVTLASLIICFGLTACSSFSLGGATPNAQFESITDQKKGVQAGNTESINPRAIEDMQNLSAQSAQGAYRIGPSDLLDIKVFQADELSREVRVDQQGSITLPLMGSIRVEGLTQIELEKRLADLLGRDLLRNPQVSVFIKEFTSQRVTVEGEVKNQGVYPISSEVTILQVIAMAGGLGEFASAENVRLFRKRGREILPYIIDLNAIRSGQVSDPLIRNDDRIVVSRAEDKRVTVDGEVITPGVFPFSEKITVLQAIALAQGLSNFADADKVAVFRRENGQEKVYSVNLTQIRQGLIPDPFIQSNDRIVVHRSDSRYWLKELAPLLTPLSAIASILIR